MSTRQSKTDKSRFSSKRKTQAVLRLLRGEDLETLSRELGVAAARLSRWRDDFLDEHAEQRLDDGRRAVVRNGYQPERTVQTGIGDVPVQVAKTRDRSGTGIHFTSNVLPPYLRRSRSVEELLP